MSLIDKDKINYSELSNPYEATQTKWLIDKQPVVDAVPVVHAHWIPEVYPNGKVQSYHCSACFEKTGHYVYGTSNYCPNCGAKMDGEPHEAE